jgi:hypothetical protein
MSLWHYVVSTICACVLSVSAFANAQLSSSAPQTYTVRQGDTLWDISAQFLKEPWRWEEIWEGNQQVKNPNLIFPGDVLHLVFHNGKPAVRLSREGRPVVKLSPTVRSGPARAGYIPSIPIDAITHFLSRPLVVGESELDTAPYVVSLGTEALIGGSGSTVFVRGLGDAPQGLYTVVRRGEAFIDPDATDGEPLGYQALHISDASLEAVGDPATLKLVRARREVLVGDRLVPAKSEGSLGSFMPHPPSKNVLGKIISVIEGVSQIGQYQIVVLNVGAGAGLDPGSVLEVYQQGAAIQDRYALNPSAPLPEPDEEIEFDPERQRGIDGLTMTLDRFARDIIGLVTPEDTSYRDFNLPELRAGRLMVFRTFDRLSYAIVMDASRAMHLADVVKSP